MAVGSLQFAVAVAVAVAVGSLRKESRAKSQESRLKKEAAVAVMTKKYESRNKSRDS